MVKQRLSDSMSFSVVFPALILLKSNVYPVMIPLASTGLGEFHDSVMKVEVTLDKLMLVGGPEGTAKQSIAVT